MLLLTLPDGQRRQVEEGSTLLDLAAEFADAYASPIVEGIFNGECCDLQRPLTEDGTVDFIEVNSEEGMRVYVRTLLFIFLTAARSLYPSVKIEVRNTLGSALYCVDSGDDKLSARELMRIEAAMRTIVEKKEKITLQRLAKREIMDRIRPYASEDRLALLAAVDDDALLTAYFLGSEAGYLFGSMCPDAGYTPNFELLKYDQGIILNYPDTGKWDTLPEFKDQRLLNSAFQETEEWAAMIKCNTVGKLNRIIELGYADKIVQIAEALHEKKIAAIADLINKRREQVKLILIAGPSSSGKTSLAQRLSVQLAVNGLFAIPVSMDDYYLNREDTPRKADGNYDFETLEAIDLKLFNEHLLRLMQGEKVELPKYNFQTGSREYRGREIQLTPGFVLLVEGIHGLNERLTSMIPAENKIKVYVSALTPMSMDEHTRINTTDMRLLRRIVRDAQFRAIDVTRTLRQWEDVRYGEEQYIFPFQNSADVIFNTTLIYEFAVLKKYARASLQKVPRDAGKPYLLARRLLWLMNHVQELVDEVIPNNSNLREFIGGSVFKDAL